jgi:hypothetical protein
MTTPTLREAAQQALVALLHHTEMTRPITLTDDAIAALCAALAQPVPDAVPLDSRAVTAAWQAFCRTADHRQALEWIRADEGPGALFVAFRAGLAGAAPVAQQAEPPTLAMLTALRFYARGEHYIPDDAEEFDTVSGEPPNWLMSGREDSQTMVENGQIARAALRGVAVNWIDGDEDVTPQPIDGEAIAAAHPQQPVPLTREQIKAIWMRHPEDSAPKPLTDEQIDAAVEAWFTTADPPFSNRMRAAFAAAGIVPAPTTDTGEQQ